MRLCSKSGGKPLPETPETTPAKEIAPGDASSFWAMPVAIFALVLAGGAWWEIKRAEEPTTRVLIYDESEIPLQLLPFVKAGYTAEDIMRQAFDRALAKGHIILRASEDARGGEQARFQIDQFVALPPSSTPTSAPTSKGLEEWQKLLSDTVPVSAPDE